MNKQVENTEEQIKVIVGLEKIRFFRDNFGIVVCSIDKTESGKPELDDSGYLILKGTMPMLQEGSTYKVIAKYSPDTRWGKQYTVISMCNYLDMDTHDDAAKRKFLASLYTENQIEAMYNALEDPFDVLSNKNATSLVKVKGCGMKTAVAWIKRFHESYSIAKVLTELEGYNLTNNLVQKLLDKYNGMPEIVIDKIKTNPYVLCTEVNGIGWKTADRIALEGGLDPLGIERVQSYMHYYLDTKGQSGCSWITPDELLGAILDNVSEEVTDETISEAIHNLPDLWVSEDKERIGLQKYYDIEEKIAKELLRIRNAKCDFKYDDWEDKIKHLEHVQGWQFSDEQLQGIKASFDENIVVIQGSAGTGKSSLVTGIINIFSNHSFVQTALSGRAASRMGEITGEEGYTIHRLLGYPSRTEDAKNLFEYHDENPLPYDIYVLDEISMVDSFLFYSLIRAIPSGCKLICLGDTGQLESIGSGNIAHDLITSDEIYTIQLTQIHRQAAKSAIITESMKVRKGIQLVEKDWAGQDTRGELQDLHLDCFGDASNTFYKIMGKFSTLMSQEGFNIMETQVLVPVKARGNASTYELNNAIQELYNPAKSGNEDKVTLYSHGRPYVLREGDKVINTVNNYETYPNIFNGNIGKIQKINLDEDYMLIEFMNIGMVEVPRKFWSAIELGYAITVHKSQGSEWSEVIVGIDFTAFNMLTRELIYTAITRAKHNCHMVAQTGALRMATGTQGISHKQTHLVECLYNVAHPKPIKREVLF